MLKILYLMHSFIVIGTVGPWVRGSMVFQFQKAANQTVQLTVFPSLIIAYFYRRSSISELTQEEDQLSATRLLISLLPVPNRDTLWELLEFLSKVNKHSTDALDESGQTVSNLLLVRICKLTQFCARSGIRTASA